MVGQWSELQPPGNCLHWVAYHVIDGAPLVPGGKVLLQKLQMFQPKIAVFNGKGIFEIFSGKKEFMFGKQPEKIEGTQTVRGCDSPSPLVPRLRLSQRSSV